MIHGVVNFRYELMLSLVVGNSNGKREFVNTVIDTGFDGFLSLPSEVIIRLGSIILDIIAEAHQGDRPVRLRVLSSSPARILYERLGFVIVETTPERYFMEFI